MVKVLKQNWRESCTYISKYPEETFSLCIAQLAQDLSQYGGAENKRWFRLHIFLISAPAPAPAVQCYS